MGSLYLKRPKNRTSQDFWDQWWLVRVGTREGLPPEEGAHTAMIGPLFRKADKISNLMWRLMEVQRKSNPLIRHLRLRVGTAPSGVIFNHPLCCPSGIWRIAYN